MSTGQPGVHPGGLPAQPFADPSAVTTSLPQNEACAVQQPQLDDLVDLGSPPIFTPPSSNVNNMNNFGSAAVDIDILEKEIVAREQSARDQRRDLSGQLSAAPNVQKPRRNSPMAEVSLDSELDTLDEPVWDTVQRDLKTVGAKLAHVILPHGDKQQLLRDWDLWGPLFICVALSLLLQTGDQGAPKFTEVFSLTFFGSCVVTMNMKLLGGRISFFQSLCVLGYCLLPTALAAVASKMLRIFVGASRFGFFLRLVLSFGAFLWATYASVGFLAGCGNEKRRALVLYPIFLFYFVISWLVISHS